MKKIFILLLLTFIIGCNFTYSQNNVKKDTTTISTEKEPTFTDNLNSIKKDSIKIGVILKKDYDKYGFIGFVRVYKFLIIIILIFVALWLLSARSKKDE